MDLSPSIILPIHEFQPCKVSGDDTFFAAPFATCLGQFSHVYPCSDLNVTIPLHITACRWRHLRMRRQYSSLRSAHAPLSVCNASFEILDTLLIERSTTTALCIALLWRAQKVYARRRERGKVNLFLCGSCRLYFVGGAACQFCGTLCKSNANLGFQWSYLTLRQNSYAEWYYTMDTCRDSRKIK